MVCLNAKTTVNNSSFYDALMSLQHLTHTHGMWLCTEVNVGFGRAVRLGAAVRFGEKNDLEISHTMICEV